MSAGTAPPESLPTPRAPSVRAWRKRARAARREHHHRTLRDTLTDLYTAFWFLLIYAVPLYLEVDRHLRTPGAAEGVVERHWLVIAALLASAGLAWQGLRAIGPMLATPAEQHWAVSSPLSRRGWLTGRFVGVTAGGAAVGALAALAVVLLGIRELETGSGGGSGAGRVGAAARGVAVGGVVEGTGRVAAAGAVFGAALVALSVVAQGSRSRRRWPSIPGPLLLATGGFTALAVVAAHYGGRTLPAPTGGTGVALLALGVPLASVAVWRAVAVLGRLDRARLGAGAQLAAAAVTAAVWLDVTVLGGVLEVRRWRRVGRVRSRRPLGALPGFDARAWALLQAELLRTARRPRVLAVWAGLALAQYGMGVVAPSLAGVSQVVLSYIVAGRLMAGLRQVARSDALRRSLGGSEWLLRGVHVVVPAAMTLLWWLATLPAGSAPAGTEFGLAGPQATPSAAGLPGSGLALAGLLSPGPDLALAALLSPGPDLALAALLALGTVAAAYRAATRRPMDYDTGMLETPFGTLPVGLVLQLGRGPDLLGAVIVARVLLG